MGIRDLVPEESEKFQQLMQGLSVTFEANHYQHIQTPTLESFEALAVGMVPALQQNAIKFFGPNGQLLVLRPDHTVPIARLVATRMQASALPLKLYYTDSIFRQSSDAFDPEIEAIQSGVELIGESGPQADAQMVELMIMALKALGVENFGIDIGHTDFIKDLDQEKQEALLRADYRALGYIPKRGGLEVAQGHQGLTYLYDYLKEKGLSQHVHFNQGLVKELRYYTGIIFEAYIPGVRQSVASGGRYDQLLEKFGFPSPAIGFAFHLNRLSGWKNA
jgi:ATP phosphoribosyltransferase regulatory subunit